MFAPGYVDGPVCVHLASCWRSQVNSYDECELLFVNVKGGCQEKERKQGHSVFRELNGALVRLPLAKIGQQRPYVHSVDRQSHWCCMTHRREKINEINVLMAKLWGVSLFPLGLRSYVL